MGSPASTAPRACGEKGGGPCETNPATPVRLQDRPAAPGCQCGRGAPCGGLRACHALTLTGLACSLPQPAHPRPFSSPLPRRAHTAALQHGGADQGGRPRRPWRSARTLAHVCLPIGHTCPTGTGTECPDRTPAPRSGREALPKDIGTMRPAGARRPTGTALARSASACVQRTAHRTCDAPQVRCRWVLGRDGVRPCRQNHTPVHPVRGANGLQLR